RDHTDPRIAAVVAAIAVITEHEHVPRRNDRRRHALGHAEHRVAGAPQLAVDALLDPLAVGRVLAALGLAARPQHAPVDRCAVAPDDVVADLDLVAGHADDPLDDVDVVVRALHDHD